MSVTLGKRQKLHQTAACDPDTGSQQDGHVFIISALLTASTESVSLCMLKDFYESIHDYYSDVTKFTEVGRERPLALRYEIRRVHSRSMALIFYALELNMGESQELCNITLSVCLHIVGMRNVIHRLGCLKTGSPVGSDI